MNIIDYPSPNYFYSNLPIRAISLHGSAGNLAGALATLTNPRVDNPGAAVSSNYVIAENGDVYRLVAWWKNRRSYANGVVKNPDANIKWLVEAVGAEVNLNLLTISIEHVASDYAMKHAGRLTDAAWRSSQDLVKKLLADCKLVASDQTVIGHYQINSVDKSFCPGVINVPAYIEKLLGK
jgi:hypothetical protein